MTSLYLLIASVLLLIASGLAGDKGKPNLACALSLSAIMLAIACVLVWVSR